ncbi:guanine nucleotide binding protein, alpha subunit [Chytriomyces sp. MP71]|nr:guanine nucleotide binding protein, alpha subunit [Chytriomyces sp. MP71]
MKLLYGAGFTQDDYVNTRPAILLNLLACVGALIRAMDALQIPYGFDARAAAYALSEAGGGAVKGAAMQAAVKAKGEIDVEDEPRRQSRTNWDGVEVSGDHWELQRRVTAVDPVASLARKVFCESGSGLTPALRKATAIVLEAGGVQFGLRGGKVGAEVPRALQMVWEDRGIQYCVTRAGEFQLPDSCGYVTKHMARISDPDHYVPTEEDVLNCRIFTVNVSEHRFTLNRETLLVYDVGGQRSERKKWAPFFTDVTAILFVAAISSYDQVLYEDESTNRMVETMTLFQSICKNKFFGRTNIILLLNKVDLFKQKITTKPVSHYFPQYTGPNTYEASATFFDKIFQRISKDCGDRSFYSHHTWATDRGQIKIVLSAVADTILRSNLAALGYTMQNG